MSFDPKSLERLQELGRKLPQPLPIAKKKKAPKQNTLHPVETEENPKELFRELMNISQDGTVPPHLMNRLKEIEAKKSLQQHSNTSAPVGTRKQAKHGALLVDSNKDIENNLYRDFQQLLLEDEEEI